MAPPDLKDASVDLLTIKEEARSCLLSALDARRGKKLLVLDRRVAPIVNQLVETPLLREHGVEGVQFLATRAKNDMSQLPPVPAQCGHVVFLMRPDVEYVDTLQAWVKSVRETRDDVDLSALFVPRRTVACDQALDTAGIAGDIACFEVDILMLPVERDVVSLEIERAFAEVVLEGDTSSLFYAATALLRFQQRFGGVESVLAVGRAAAATCGILAKLRHGLQASELPRPGGKIESIVIIDRAADLVSTLLTQMTYEGLIDEVVGISNGVVELPRSEADGNQAESRASPASTSAPMQPTAKQGPQRIALNSSDRVFRELQDLSYAAAASWLREKAASLQQDYRSLDAHAATVQGMKAFVRRMHALPELQRHTLLAEMLSERAADDVFRSRIRAEQSLLEGGKLAAELAAEVLESMMVDRQPLEMVLRLLCLATHAPGGLPRQPWEGLSRALLHSYGHEHCLTLQDLRRCGLACARDGGKSAYTLLKRPMGMLVDSLDELDPSDCAYVFGGYAPLCARVVERWIKGTLPGDALRTAAGVCFEMKQTISDRGMPVEERVDIRPAKGPWPGGGIGGGEHRAGARSVREGQVVVVAVLGGVTPAEISALRWLEKSGGVGGRIVVLTTKVQSGRALIKTVVPSAVEDSDRVRERILSQWGAEEG